jgi:hypothetical protein
MKPWREPSPAFGWFMFGFLVASLYAMLLFWLYVSQLK